MQSKMKIFAVLLVSSVALCLAASDKKVGKNVEKNHQKRGLIGGAEYGPYGEFAAAPFIASSPQFIQNTNGFAPLAAAPLAAAPLAAAPLAAAPLAHAVPQYAPAFQAAPAPQFAPIGRSLQYAPAYAPAYPVAAPVHQVPTHVNTVVKNVHVPYERHIKVDNPIHVPFERIQHIDNPVPVVKIVKQPYPVHVDEPVHIPVIKEVRVPAPYVHKVRLIIQRIIKDEIAPTTPAPFVAEEEKSLPIEAPKQQYLPPTPQYLPPAPQQAPQPIPHFEPAPLPNNKYGPPAYTPPAPHFEPAPQQHFHAQQQYQAPAPQYQAPAPQYQAPAPQYQAPAPQYQAPQQQYQAPQQQFHAPSPPSTSYGHPERHQGYH